MNKILLILVFVSALSLNSNSQYYWEWARSGQTNSEATGTDVVLNPADGGQTLAGNYRGAELAFQPAGFATFPNPGSDNDSYIIHFDASNTPVYSFHIGRTGNYCVITDMVHGPDGTLYVTGYFDGTADVGGTEGAGTILNSGFDLVAGFIAAYDADGALIWAEKLASEQVRVPNCIGTDGTNVFVGGYWSDSSLFDILFGNPGDQGFIARYDVSGNSASLAWEHGIESWGDDQVLDLAVAGTELYVTAFFSDDVDIETVNTIAGESSLSHWGQRDGLVISFDQSNGALNWSTPIRGSGAETLNSITEKDGNLYITGVIQNNTNFPGFGTLSNLVSNQMCVARLNTINGNVDWAFSEGGPNSGTSVAYDIIVTANDQVVVAGSYEGFAEFSGTAPDKITTVSRQADPFVASYNTAGDLNWLRYVSPSPSDDHAYAVSSDATNSIFLTGSYNFGAADTDIASDGVDITTGTGNNANAFIAKLYHDEAISEECGAGGETDFPAGSWIIPMDNDNQPGKEYTNEPPYYPNAGTGAGGTTPFNLYAYGLVNALLQNEIPVYWVIKEGKAKDEADIEAEAFEVYPIEDASAATKAFVSGPFVIHQQYVELARTVIEDFGNEVHVFETTTDNTLSVRHKLTFKPNVVLFNNGGIKGAEWQYEKFEALLLMAGFTSDHYSIGSAEDLSLGLSSCVTFCAEAHWKEGEDGTTTPYSTEATARVKQFVLGGGNFLAQCAGIEAYENYQFFHTTEGMITEGDAYYSDSQKSQVHTELLPDDPFYQIHGDLDIDPTGTFVGIGISSGGYKYFVRPGVSKTNGDQVAGSIKLTPDNEQGGYVFYLGGHDYRKRKSDSKPYDPAFVNGIRMFLNAIFIPPTRPSSCTDVSFCNAEAPCNTSITYPSAEFCRTDANPVPTITGEAGGTFTEDTGSVVFTDDTTGEIDLMASARGPYTITYTSPSGCVATFDIHNYAPPSIADAGSNQALCTGPDATLAAVPPITGTGQWTVIAGSADIIDPSDPATTVTSLSPGMNTFRWTVSNGPCDASQDDVNVFVDNIDPLVICLINQTKNVNASCEYIVQDLTGTAGVAETCSYTITQSIPEGTTLPIGSHSLTFTATDEAGNVGSCTTNLIVQDNTSPWFDSCPSDITSVNDPGVCGAVISWVGPTADDNCSYVLTQISGPANGDLFPIGVTTVTYQAEDPAGNTTTCSFDVTVTDNEAPVFDDCPADIARFTNSNSCVRMVSWQAPEASDNCSFSIVQTAGPSSGSFIVTGVHIIEYTATDAAGNSATCSFTVTVTDNEEPEFEDCPPVILHFLDPGSCEAVVSWDDPIATDNCAISSVVQTGGPVSGSNLSAGPHMIEYTASDESGNTRICSFNVVVIDDEEPEIHDCPMDISISADTGACDAVVNWTTPTASDNCSATITQTAGQASGSAFAVGVHTIEYTATDLEDNLATCSFQITVTDDEFPVIDDCPNDISVSTEAGSCDAVVSWATPTASDNCSATITQTAGQASGSAFAVGVHTIEYTATDLAGNAATCSFQITVTDDASPVIDNCPNDISASTDAGSCDAVVSWTAPTASDNCSATITQTTGPTSGSAFAVGVHTIEYTATDLAGNSVTCAFTITVTDDESPVIDGCPEDISVSTDPGSCEAVVSWVVPTTSDNCSSTITQSFGASSGSSFAAGVHIIEYTATDGAGNSLVCSFTITVTEDESPVIDNCPNDISVSADPGVCEAVVSWTEPTTTDNCGASIAQTAGPASGSTFAVGVHTIEYTAIDLAGNSVTCSFNVTVTDDEAPVIDDCPEDITVNADPGTCDAVVNWNEPTVLDNCSGAVISQVIGPASGSTFSLGSTTISYIATDNAGLTADCTFTVTVLDQESPVIFDCPADTILDAGSGCVASYSWVEPTATDNCVLASFTQTEGPANGADFPLGISTVTYNATDAEGNSIQCSFTVEVVDTTAPELVGCPAYIEVNAESNGCGAVVEWNSPSANDGCGFVVPQQTTGEPSGSYFEIGTHVITYTATDDQGNTSECSFEITVSDNHAPTFTSCPNDIFIAAGQPAEWTEPEASDNCDTPVLTQTQGLPNGSTFPMGVSVVSYEATDAHGNSAICSFNVVVNDDDPPVFANCPEDITLSTDMASCTAVYSWQEPTAEGNDPGTTVIQTQGPPSGSEFEIGTTLIEYLATDLAGNISVCSFTVTVEDTMAPSINGCPADIDLVSDENSCGTIVSWEEPNAADHCSDVQLLQYSGPANGSFQLPGIYEVVYHAEDGAGNETWCSFEIIVSDETPPVFENCPTNIAVESDPETCGTIVNWEEPEATDNCGISSLSQIAGIANGEFFPSGSTEVVYEATDEAGNTSYCSFWVEVVDNEPPQLLTGPEDMIVGVSTTYCSAMVVWLEPTGYDNCSDVTVEQTVGLYSGSNFQLGENEVVYTFTDEAGNTADWGFTITVIDDIQPTIISSPEDIVTCDPVVSWEEPEASDTCSPVEIVQVEGMPSGSEFPLGIHDIVYEISDESGNVSTCSFTVEVLPDPDATWGTPGTLCSNMRPLDLSDFVLGDDGGEFEGVGMNGMMFDPGAVTAGFHEITYTVTNQACSDSWTELIEVVEAVEVISSSEHEFCGLHGGLRVTVSSGQGIWTGPEGAVFDPSPMANDVTVTVPDYGDHIFTYTVEGSEICGAELSIETTFFEPPSDAIAGNDQVLFAEYETSMQANEPEVGEGTWELIEGNALVQDELDPESAISQLALGENIFTWKIHNGVCEASVDTVVIFVQDLIFPTGISPNNDGDNDFLVIKGIEGMQNSITIFDRWGKQIYQADNYQNDWGGTTRKGKPLPEDTYFYVVDTPIKQFSGYLVIKR